jgi:hypothetical protein
MGKILRKGILVLVVAALIMGCATSKPVPFSFVEGEAESASIDIVSGSPGVRLIYFDKNELPPPEEETHWNPISFPAGQPLQFTVHAYYYQQGNTTTTSSFLINVVANVASSAVAASRNVDRDVVFECPALEAGKAYKLVFRKGAGAAGKNLLVLTNVMTGKIVHEQEFENI